MKTNIYMWHDTGKGVRPGQQAEGMQRTLPLGRDRDTGTNTLNVRNSKRL